jgi:hypothetical protein
LNIQDLPAQVGRSLRNLAGSAPIEMVQRRNLNGRTIYEAAIRRNGQLRQIRVDEHGVALEREAESGTETEAGTADQRRSLSRGRFEGTTQGGNVRIQTGRDPARDQLGTRSVTLNEVPTGVRAGIERQAGGGRIEGIDRGVINGRVVYDVRVRRNGIPTEIRIAEDGTYLGTR